MAIYRRRNSKYWWINLPRGKGVPRLQVSSGTENETEARIVEQTLKAALRKESPADRLHRLIDNILDEDTKETVPLIPLNEIWNTYVSSPSLAVNRKTKGTRKGHLKQLFRWLEKRYPTVTDIGAVTSPIAYAYADHLSSNTSTGKTYNEHRGSLVHIWKTVAKRAGLSTNVWDDIPRASNHESQSGRAFTPDEVPEILKAAKQIDNAWWYGPSLLSLYTGLRLSSIKALKWEDIQDDWLIHTPPKTQRHKITVRLPLHSSVQAMLRDVRASHNDKRIFPWLHSRKRSAPTFADVLAAAGVDTTGHVTFHCWRHTFRTRLAQARVSEDAAKRLGGWTTDINLTYNHDESQLRDAIDSLPLNLD